MPHPYSHTHELLTEPWSDLSLDPPLVLRVVSSSKERRVDSAYVYIPAIPEWSCLRVDLSFLFNFTLYILLEVFLFYLIEPYFLIGNIFFITNII